MKARYLFLLAIAVFIDAIQFALGWMAFAIGIGLQVLTPVGGAVAGAAAGTYACFNATTGIVSAVISAGKCAVGGALVGAAASTFGIPIGSALGFGLEIVISLTLGSALILLLLLNGMYYQNRMFGNMLLELVPGIDVLPGWTFMVVLCIMRNVAEEKAKETGSNVQQGLQGVTQIASNNPIAIAKGVAQVTQAVRQPSVTNKEVRTQGASVTTRSFASGSANIPQISKDITPRPQTHAANDNRLYVHKAA